MREGVERRSMDMQELTALRHASRVVYRARWESAFRGPPWAGPFVLIDHSGTEVGPAAGVAGVLARARTWRARFSGCAVDG